MTDWRPSFHRPRNGQRAATMRELLNAGLDADELMLCQRFFDSYSTGHGFGGLTPLTGILRGPGPLEERPAPEAGRSLEAELLAVLPTGPVHVAVSGGVDSWLLVRLLQSRGQAVLTWYLESGMPGYCERERILSLAAFAGVECRAIPSGESAFHDALSDFLRVTETPIYGLHPVSKFLLARGLKERGVGSIITGDGADQVARWDRDCDLLPLTMACFLSAGVRMIAPFLAANVRAAFPSPDPHKTAIREIAARYGLPPLAKTPAVFPAVTNLLDQTTQMLLNAFHAEYAQCAALRA